MEGEVEREDVFRVADELHWRIVATNKKGYVKLLCPCGRHKTWVHRTPSNPNYYRERVKFLRRHDCKPPKPPAKKPPPPKRPRQ